MYVQALTCWNKLNITVAQIEISLGLLFFVFRVNLEKLAVIGKLSVENIKTNDRLKMLR